MSNISLKQLEILIAIVECGNFTEAANHLYLAQSTVSSHIQALEDALRVTLFRRESKKHITLTPEGKRVYQYAREVMEKCRALEGDVIGETNHELVIGASTAPSRSLLPRYVFAFTQAHPECCCSVRDGDSEQIQKLLLSGDIQIGFVGSADNRQSLTYERIAEDRLALITPNTPHFAALQRDGKLGRDLLFEPMVCREHGSGTQKMIDNYLSSREIDPKKMRVAAYVSSPDLLQELVAMGAGVSILSALSVEEQVRAGRLLAFALDEQPVCRSIYMTCRKKGAISNLAKAFMALVREDQKI